MSDNYTEEITTIVKRHLKVFYEVEAEDTVCRFNFTSKERKNISPWIMRSRSDYQLEEYEIWQNLDDGVISDTQALTKFICLMNTYYASKTQSGSKSTSS